MHVQYGKNKFALSAHLWHCGGADGRIDGLSHLGEIPPCANFYLCSLPVYA
jgi:hypothetical protein